jgi:protoheme IX farnesyltransferase
MMPAARGIPATRLQILLYSLVLAPVGVVPAFIGMATPVYGVIAAALGLVFLVLAWRVYRMPDGDTRMKRARRLFGFSLLYLFLLFAVMLLESTLVPGLTA